MSEQETDRAPHEDEETVVGEVVDEKEVGWGDELGKIPFEVWRGGKYKLVKVSEEDD